MMQLRIGSESERFLCFVIDGCMDVEFIFENYKN